MRARRRLTGHDEYRSVRGREQEGPSTPMLETSTVADQRKTKETTGGGEELEDNVESGTTTDARCGKDEETNTEVGSMADERHRVTDDDGWVKPSRGKRGTKEGAGRDKAVTRATKDTDTEVGVMARSTAREHDEQGESGKRVMSSSKDRNTSAHSEDNIDVRESLRKASAEREESARRGVRHEKGGSGGYTRRTKGEQPVRQRRSGGPNEKESTSTEHGGSGGDGGSANIVECGGSDGANGSRPFDGDGGPGGDGGSRGTVS